MEERRKKHLVVDVVKIQRIIMSNSGYTNTPLHNACDLPIIRYLIIQLTKHTIENYKQTCGWKPLLFTNKTVAHSPGQPNMAVFRLIKLISFITVVTVIIINIS